MRRFYGWTPQADESEWNEQERAWMLALGEYHKLLCPCGCNQLAEVSQDPANEDQFKVEPIRCHARTAISRTAKQYADSDAPEALLFRVYLPE